MSMFGDTEVGRLGKGRLKAAAVVAAAGFVVSAVLTYLHLRAVADPEGYRSFCNISPGVNCDAVALSKHAVVFGVPNSVYGAFFYVFAGALAAVALRARREAMTRMTGHLFVLACAAVLYSFYLGGISYFRLRTLCVLCSGLYAINVALFVIVGSMARGSPFRLMRSVVVDLWLLVRKRHWLVAVASAASLAVLVLFGMLDVHARKSAAGRFVAKYKDLVPVEISHHASVAFGPEKALVRVVEYTEYGCGACREVARTVKDLVRRYPEQVRVVIKDYPLSYDCREGGDPRELPVPCLVPLVARYAHEEGKWWDTTESLFRRYEELKTWEDVLAVAAEAGLDTTELIGALVEGDLLAELRSDIEEVHSLGIDEVPTFVINDRILPVVPSSHMFDAIVEYETAETLTGQHEHQHRSAP